MTMALKAKKTKDNFETRLWECATRLIKLIEPWVKSQISLDEFEAGFKRELQALIRTESERCLAIVKRYAQQQADSYALGGPMPPDWMEAYDEILGTSPGKERRTHETEAVGSGD